MNTTQNSPRFIVMSAATTPSAKCWGTYRRYAVVELEPGFIGRPRQISTRARGVARIVETWENCCVGTTRHCSSARAAADAQDLCDDLNGRWGARAQAEAMAQYNIR